MHRSRKFHNVMPIAVLSLFVGTLCSGCSLGGALLDGVFLGLSETVSAFIQGLVG